MEVKTLKDMFEKEYGEGVVDVYFSPGRVNLIGEHIDYNGGYVFPGALTIGIYGMLRDRSDNIIRLRSKNAIGEVVIDLDREIVYDERDDWGNYPKGVIKKIMELGYKVNGFDILFYSNLPDGAGLSSSAAIEVLTAYILLHKNKAEDIDRVEIAKLCQEVENKFVGVNCGIMDQFAVSVGRENNAILLDCSNLYYEYVPFNLKDSSLVIMNTNKRRELSESKYNERRAECDKALDIIKAHKEIENLCQAEIKDLDYIEDETIKKRARHAITENMRVKEAVKVLREGDIEAFSKLLIQSHKSLKEDYEVTGLHLDAIVEEALKFKGCLGARMTGAGFGGCAIAIVKEGMEEEFINEVSNRYKDRTGIKADFYISKIGDGVKFIGRC
ncbi:galactokinase [Caloramator proteoclasticus]|uniref:Galactokinase n=1 Tax=Caloramator proteoclasticus DSM 10124 TaxID=1121262 RepID=A0A1M5A767_9CLOT|nr:galactokinase [Caloramator proteoclasticus]SHF25672.1 galactokinase [Caloramator proteoclasticus DSM 10124]